MKPVIGITIGDYNGIGPEVIIKTLSDNRLVQRFVPVIYGHTKMFSFWRKALKVDKFNFTQIKTLKQLNAKRINLINCWENAQDVEVGIASEIAGQCAVAALNKCVEDAKNGEIDAILTAPINKKTAKSESFNFPGHTEFLAASFGAKEFAMVMVSGKLKVAMATGHMALSEVPKVLSKELILKKLHVLVAMLKKQFGIEKPRIAVLGVNPHAGEEGMLGNEEIEIIIPAINEFKKDGALALGPFPADGFFGTAQYQSFDAVLAMYHDQGLVPFKSLAFGRGVNFTAGLPVPRTSPDHGTAYNLAGKGIADEASFREALYLAIDVVRHTKNQMTEPAEFQF